MGNRQLVANVQADLDKVVKLQEKRIDLQSRLEALDILQDRITQLEKYRASQPMDAVVRPVPGRRAGTQAARRILRRRARGDGRAGGAGSKACWPR